MSAIGRKPRIGLLFTTQDRFELALMALTTATEGIDPAQFEVTVLWLDGSAQPDALDFVGRFTSDRVRLIKEGGYRNLGAARAIQLGMNRLQELGDFDWIGMFESDWFYQRDWLSAALRAAAAATADGLKVGATTAQEHCRPGQHKDYAILDVVSAGNVLFVPDAWRLVPPECIAHAFHKKYFADLCRVSRVHPSPQLGWDWIFVIALYHGGGFHTVTTPQPMVVNCGIPAGELRTNDRIIAQAYADVPEAELRVPLPRRPAEWEAAVRMCHAHSDASILRCADAMEFSYLSLEFLPSWYAKEEHDRFWCRWASGAADVLVHNSGSRKIGAAVEFESWWFEGSQAVGVRWNGAPIGELGRDARFRQTIEIAPGTNVLRFDPTQPGHKLPLDYRRMAFLLRSDFGWASAHQDFTR